MTKETHDLVFINTVSRAVGAPVAIQNQQHTVQQHCPAFSAYPFNFFPGTNIVAPQEKICVSHECTDTSIQSSSTSCIKTVCFALLNDCDSDLRCVNDDSSLENFETIQSKACEQVPAHVRNACDDSLDLLLLNMFRPRMLFGSIALLYERQMLNLACNVQTSLATTPT